MSACNDCLQAELSDINGHWGGYRSDCNGCMARLVARSQHAFHAMHENGNGDKGPLRDLIKRVLTGIPEAEAKAIVWHWWKIDHR